MSEYTRFSPNYPITDSGSIDMLGDEFPSLLMRPVRRAKSPLAADFPDADTSNWSSDPRPTITAWEGADMDAYWKDGEVWRHCQTGELWPDTPANLLDAVRAAGLRPANDTGVTLNTVADLICASILSSTSLDCSTDGVDGVAMGVAAE